MKFIEFQCIFDETKNMCCMICVEFYMNFITFDEFYELKSFAIKEKRRKLKKSKGNQRQTKEIK